MPLLDVMQAYFRGEKIEALGFLVPVGLLLIGFAVVAIKAERPDFGWGVAGPCLLFGLAILVTGATVGARTERQVSALEQQLATDPAALVRAELPRMRRVNSSFTWYIRGYLAFAVLGLALRFGLKAAGAHGAGAALVLVAGLGFLVDGFAERRARPYTAALETLAQKQGR